MDHTATTPTNLSASATTDADCERVNTVLDQLVEGQPVSAADEDFLYDHATDCSPCFGDIKKQHAFVDFLNQRVSRRPIPTRLHESILSLVQHEMA